MEELTHRNLTLSSFSSHSIRKGSAQSAVGGTPDSAPAAAVSRRMGHTLGVEDRYFLVMDGLDNLVGRLAAGIEYKLFDFFDFF